MSVQGMSHSEAISIFKTIRVGPVTILVTRRDIAQRRWAHVIIYRDLREVDVWANVCFVSILSVLTDQLISPCRPPGSLWSVINAIPAKQRVIQSDIGAWAAEGGRQYWRYLIQTLTRPRSSQRVLRFWSCQDGRPFGDDFPNTNNSLISAH